MNAADTLFSNMVELIVLAGLPYEIHGDRLKCKGLWLYSNPGFLGLIVPSITTSEAHFFYPDDLDKLIKMLEDRKDASTDALINQEM